MPASMPAIQESAPPKAFHERTGKPQAFITFCEARKNHQSIGASGRAAGISRATATRYETLRIQGIEQENRLLDAKGAIATKTEVAEELSRSLRDCEPQYKASIASSLAKVMGYEAPTRSQIEVRSVPASVESWMQSCLTIDVSIEADDKQLTERNSQPKALTDVASETVPPKT